MTIVGCDFHPAWQQVAVFDAETGEIRELKLDNGNGEAERFYRQLSSPALIGFEAQHPLPALNRRVAQRCPNSLRSRLTHGEWTPVSSAIRLRGIPPNTSFIAFGVVLSLCSSSTPPTASNTQYQLERSPKSKPIVSC